MQSATATPYGKTFPEVRRESVCGCSDPLLLAGTFLEEVHGHDVTLAPFGAVMCVNIHQTALSSRCHDRMHMHMHMHMYQTLNPSIVDP